MSNCIFTAWVPFARKMCEVSRWVRVSGGDLKMQSILKHWPSRQARRIGSTRTDGNGVLAVRYLVLPKIQSQQVLVKDTHVPTSNLSCFFFSFIISYKCDEVLNSIRLFFISSQIFYATSLQNDLSCFWNELIMYTLNSDEYIMYVLMILKTARLIEENKHHFLMIEIIIIIYRYS